MLVGYRPCVHPVHSNKQLHERSSIVVASIGRQILPAADTETAPSILWLATIQCIESKQDLAGLAPKGCFIPAKPVERVVGQIGQTQKATCEVGGQDQWISAELGPASVPFVMPCDARSGSESTESARPNIA